MHFDCYTKAHRKWHVQVFTNGKVLLSNARDGSSAPLDFCHRVEMYRFVRELLISSRSRIEIAQDLQV